MTNKAQVIITASDRTKAAFDSAKRNVEGLTSSLFGVRTAITGLIGAAGFGAMIRSTVESADKIQKLSVSLGASTEALSQYRLVAERSGTTLDSLALIWQRQTRRIAEAAVGTGEARDALRELGLSAEELNRLSPDQQFEVIADAMGQVENQADKLRLAFKLFDSEGARPALQAMADGAEGLRAMRAEADAMGLTLSRVEAEHLVEFKDQLTNIKSSVAGVGQQLVVSLGPALEAASKWLSDAIVQARIFWSTMGGNQADATIQALERQRDELVKTAEQIKTNIEIMKGVEGGAAAVAALEEQYKGVSDQVKEINQQLLDSPITGVVKPFEAPAGVGDLIGDPKGTLAEEAAAERRKKEFEREREHLLAKVELIRESTLTERELEIEKHEERLALLEEFAAIDQEKFLEAADIREELQRQHKDRLLEIETEAADKRKNIEEREHRERIRDAKSFLNNIASASDAGGKAIFTLRKIAAISEGILNLRESVSDAYKWGTKIGGPPLGVAFAAAAAAAQTANLAAIAATQYGGGGGGGSSGGGTIGPTNAFELPETRQEQSPVTQEVTINVGTDLSSNIIRDFIEQINEQIDDGVLISKIRVA